MKKELGYGSLFAVLFSVLGYFVYGGLDGFFGILLLDILLTLTSLTGLIPIVGVLIYAIIGWMFVVPWTLEFTGLATTWVVPVVFTANLIGTVIMTVTVTIYIFK